MKLELSLFKDKLPDVPHRSSSYGGQWYSDFILVFHPSGGVDCHQFTVGWSNSNHEPVTEDAKWWTGTLRGKCWRRFHENSAWIYVKDVRKNFGVEE